jgi:predicted phage terminase large subunit-like protein
LHYLAAEGQRLLPSSRLTRKAQLSRPAREIINQAQAHCANEIIIEDKGSGTSLIQDLSYESGIPRPIAFKPIGDKIPRMSAQSARIEGRQVHLPPRASWLDDFRTEMLTFPNGKHDDQVDSLSQFLDWIERPAGNRVWTQTWGV